MGPQHVGGRRHAAEHGDIFTLQLQLITAEHPTPHQHLLVIALLGVRGAFDGQLLGHIAIWTRNTNVHACMVCTLINNNIIILFSFYNMYVGISVEWKLEAWDTCKLTYIA